MHKQEAFRVLINVKSKLSSTCYAHELVHAFLVLGTTVAEEECKTLMEQLLYEHQWSVQDASEAYKAALVLLPS